MNRPFLCMMFLGVGWSLPAAPPAQPAEARRVISLDGSWQIAEGTMDHVPAAFDRSIQVPGLVTLAKPGFADPPGPPVQDGKLIAQKDPKREAFWYRRTFTLGQPLPVVARLKVAKAMFGTKAILNGVV